MNQRARVRAKVEKISKGSALFRVRRSEVLLWLQRNPGRRILYVEIARATAVPVSAVRAICRHLAKTGHELIGGRGDGE